MLILSDISKLLLWGNITERRVISSVHKIFDNLKSSSLQIKLNLIWAHYSGKDEDAKFAATKAPWGPIGLWRLGSKRTKKIMGNFP